MLCDSKFKGTCSHSFACTPCSDMMIQMGAVCPKCKEPVVAQESLGSSGSSGGTSQSQGTVASAVATASVLQTEVVESTGRVLRERTSVETIASSRASSRSEAGD